MLPRDLFGLKLSTVQVAGGLAAWLPLWLADKCVVFLSWLSFGSMKEYGFLRPKEGPLAGKARIGKTPVIDVGTVAKVKDGQIKVLYIMYVLNTSTIPEHACTLAVYL